MANSIISLQVSTQFGKVNLEFELMCKVNDDTYILSSNGKLFVGKVLAHNKWKVSGELNLAKHITEETEVLYTTVPIV